VTLVFPEGDVFAIRAKRYLARSVRVFVGSIKLSTMKVGQPLCGFLVPKTYLERYSCLAEPASASPADAIVFRQLERRDPKSESGGVSPSVRIDAKFCNDW
jgi:hypothetical protein